MICSALIVLVVAALKSKKPRCECPSSLYATILDFSEIRLVNLSGLPSCSTSILSINALSFHLFVRSVFSHFAKTHNKRYISAAQHVGDKAGSDSGANAKDYPRIEFSSTDLFFAA